MAEQRNAGEHVGAESSTSGLQRLGEAAAKAAIVVVGAVMVADEIAYLRRRLRRARSGWWDGVEHRERARIYRGDLGRLARRLPGT